MIPFWIALRSIFAALWTWLMAFILVIDWGSANIWETFIYDKSGVMHEMIYLGMFGLLFIWGTVQLERWNFGRN